MKQEEKRIHNAVCDYLRAKYPDVLFITDTSGIKLTKGQAVQAKRQRSYQFKIPDMFIAAVRGDYGGIFLEVKKDLAEVVRKDGRIRLSKHIQAQLKTLTHLKKCGYYAVFGCGYDDCIKEIEKYLKDE